MESSLDDGLHRATAAGLDVAHDAQIDARHRLIEDMEVSARSTHQQAEHEVVKLQALLSSMDTVAGDNAARLRALLGSAT